jgi:hypothetical protein
MHKSPLEDRAVFAHHVSAPPMLHLSVRAQSLAAGVGLPLNLFRCHTRHAEKAALMTNDRLTLAQVVLLGTYAVGMAGGQVLFKLAAQRFPASAAVGEQLTSLLGNTYFFVAFAANAQGSRSVG